MNHDARYSSCEDCSRDYLCPLGELERLCPGCAEERLVRDLLERTRPECRKTVEAKYRAQLAKRRK